MRFSSTAGLVALAASTAANTISSDSDLDGSVWEKLKPAKARSFQDVPRNRPFKRASGWSPPSDMSDALEEVWDHCEETYNSGDLYGFENYGWDQIIATEGTINMCVRWESTSSVTAAQRTKIATVLQAQYNKWFKWVYGYDNFPYTAITVNVVGWAVSDTSLLEGDTSDINVYTDTDSDGIPQCAEACGRYFHQDGDYSGCEAGEDQHYDQSLWLADGISGGTGGDWGQRIGREYFMELLDADNVHILLHEMGHTFGLDDFYDWTPTGQDAFIMLAGSATEVTDFDGWMFRNWWYELSRNRGWQSSTSSSGSSSSDAASSATPAATTAAAATSAAADIVADTTVVVTTAIVVETPVAGDDASSEVATPVAEAQETESASSGSGSGTVGKWQQCGGANWTGATGCESGLTCTEHNTYYSQCL